MFVVDSVVCTVRASPPRFVLSLPRQVAEVGFEKTTDRSGWRIGLGQKTRYPEWRLKHLLFDQRRWPLILAQG